MIIDIKKSLEQASTVDELKALVGVLANALNTLGDARKQVRGDTVYHSGGSVLRATDGNYYRLGISFTSGNPSMSFTLIGKTPTGE
jgi:hypothetical protein